MTFLLCCAGVEFDDLCTRIRRLHVSIVNLSIICKDVFSCPSFRLKCCDDVALNLACESNDGEWCCRRRVFLGCEHSLQLPLSCVVLCFDWRVEAGLHAATCCSVVLHHLASITPARRWCNAP